MGRHNLQYRSRSQLWLARKIVSRQPLVARIVGQQSLMRTLGLSADVPGVLQDREYSSERDTTWSRFIAPIVAVDQVGEEENSDDIVATLADVPERADVQPASIERAEEVQSQDQVAERQRTENVVRPRSIAPSVAIEHVTTEDSHRDDVTEEETLVIRFEDAHHPSINNEPSESSLDPVREKSQQEQERVDTAIKPVEHTRARRPRGRIQERPAETKEAGHATLLPPPSSSKATPRTRQEREQELSQEPEAQLPKEEDVQGEQFSSQVITADNLFVSQNTDATPQTWMARLMKAEAAERDKAASSSTTPEVRQEEQQEPLGQQQHIPLRGEEGNQRSGTEQAHVARTEVPLSQHTRRFLRPLVGIDTASIHVYQDATSERLTGMYQADAITVGNTVEMAAGHQNDTPETLGLLAHEFTHVARKRDPQFIPPLVRSKDGQSQLGVLGEEALALSVERRAQRVAQTHREQLGPTLGEPTALVDALDDKTSVSQQNNWGGLPAPWESLPDWLVAAPTTAESGMQPVANVQVAYSIDGAEEGSASTPSGGAVVQRAGQERNTNAEDVQDATATSSSSSLPNTMKMPEPDLDALAHQVYSRLKRRLGVEYRRES